MDLSVTLAFGAFLVVLLVYSFYGIYQGTRLRRDQSAQLTEVPRPRATTHLFVLFGVVGAVLTLLSGALTLTYNNDLTKAFVALAAGGVSSAVAVTLHQYERREVDRDTHDPETAIRRIENQDLRDRFYGALAMQRMGIVGEERIEALEALGVSIKSDQKRIVIEAASGDALQVRGGNGHRELSNAPRFSARFDELSRLQAGWLDGSGERIDAEAMGVGRTLATMLDRELGLGVSVFPTETGGIQLEWSTNDVESSIEIQPDRFIRFQELNLESERVRDLEFDGYDLDEVMLHVRGGRSDR
ncbi:hypothetical protein [Actinoplanes sp. GCM10030250]|uniref:hypothetical protein n=1 Tax=Actinoplanes sp. GCM10030250 TaxID=3273376 RepID=UPI0036067165